MAIDWRGWINCSSISFGLVITVEFYTGLVCPLDENLDPLQLRWLLWTRACSPLKRVNATQSIFYID